MIPINISQRVIHLFPTLQTPHFTLSYRPRANVSVATSISALRPNKTLTTNTTKYNRTRIRTPIKLSPTREILPPAATAVFIPFLLNKFGLVKRIQGSMFISFRLTDATLNYAPFKNASPWLAEPCFWDTIVTNPKMWLVYLVIDT